MKTALLLAAALALFPSPSRSNEAERSRPITIVAPGPAGSTSDIFARLLAEGLAKELGRGAIVDNRPGAGTLLGAQHVARAKPDGNTLLVGAAALAIAPHLRQHIALDPMRDFQPVRVMARFTNVVVVNEASGVQSVGDLLRQARAQPGHFNYASGGVGISEHLSAELFKSMTGADLTHVPYKSSADAVMAVIKGEALVGFANMPVALPHVRAGKVRAIAVTSAVRSPSLSEVPTVGESSVEGYEVSTWFGVLAPAGTPPAVVRRLDEATARVLSQPRAKEVFRTLGAEPTDEGPEAFARLLRDDWTKWGELIRRAGITAN